MTHNENKDNDNILETNNNNSSQIDQKQKHQIEDLIEQYSGLFIFGYGSLTWRPSFEYASTHVSLLKGYTRKFYQGSTDHRGVPGKPGRVVTIYPEPGSSIYGLAYFIPATDTSLVTSHLDYREKGGYSRYIVSIEIDIPSKSETELDIGMPTPSDTNSSANKSTKRIVSALAYVAHSENKNWMGPAPLPEIAETICSSSGPSGHNIEYFTQLVKWHKTHGFHDEHLSELEPFVLKEME